MIFQFGEWALDTELYELRRGGRPCKVEPRVFDLLLFLVRNHDRVVSRDEIIEEIWQGRIVTEATLSTCLKMARQAVGDDGRAQRLIRTVHGRGYRFVGGVTVTDGRVQRRLAAILAADVVGYSRLIESDEEGTRARVRHLYADLVEPQIKAESGRVVKTTGDGMLAEFPSAVDAVRCALGVQAAMAAEREGVADGRRIELRFGINIGDVIVEGDDIHGDGVNVAARLEALCAPGSVLISGSVFDQVQGKIDASFDDLGAQKVKNIDRPIRAYAARLGAAAPAPAPSEPAAETERNAPTARPVIAVLPFENMSRAEEDDYFADGLTEDIITALTHFRELLVIARNSTFQYKGRSVDVAQVGRELNAGYVVEGSVRRAANRVRITVQLIRADDGTHLWADRYDRDLEDIFAVQDEVTQTIAAALGVRLQDAAREIALRKSPADLTAYDCVLRARRYTVTLSPEEHARARDLLEKAIALDPNYADAYAMLANVYLAEHRFDANPRPDPIGRATAMAEKAIELDPQNSYARCWRAIIHFFNHDNARFDAEAQRALALNPNDPETLAEMGHYYAYMGEYERGAALTRRAIELNPLYPGWYHFSFVRERLAAHDYPGVLAEVRKINMPQFYWTWLMEAAARGHLGDAEGAMAALARAREQVPDFDPRAELRKWNATPEAFEQVMEGLRKAGYKD